MDISLPPEDKQPLETRDKWIDAQELRMVYEDAAAGLGINLKLTVRSWSCASELGGMRRVYGVFIADEEPTTLAS